MKKALLICCCVLLLIITGCSQISNINCPIPNVELEQNEDNPDNYLITLSNEDLEGWRLGSYWRTYELHLGHELLYWDNVTLLCRLGSLEGENLNHYYCESVKNEDIVYFIEKTPDEEGNIPTLTRKTFTYVFDENKELITKTCGSDPDLEY